MKYDIIISINVHEKPEYLFKQIENINEYVPLSKIIILNCNEYMLGEMKDINLPNVVVYPEAISKRPFHGSLTHGIVCNMSYALNNYEFDYFLVMSSREFFYKTLDNKFEIEKHIVNDSTVQVGNVDFRLPNYYKSGTYCKTYGDHVPWMGSTDKSNLVNLWWWPKFSGTALYEYIRDHKMSFAHSMHEGMCFRYDGCEYIINFFENNEDIMYELFEYDACVEEFALQSIASNYKGFYYIGNGCDTKLLNEVEPTKFTYKRKR
jgi:hypothetical protein